MNEAAVVNHPPQEGAHGKVRGALDKVLNRPKNPDSHSDIRWFRKNEFGQERAVDWDVKRQKEFVGLIFDRYKRMVLDYKEPSPGENKPRRGELDEAAEYIMEIIAKENGFDQFDHNSDVVTIENMEKFMRENDMRMDVLHSDTRAFAFFVVAGTEAEKMAALGLNAEHIAKERQGLLDRNYLGNKLARQIKSGAIGDALTVLTNWKTPKEYREAYRKASLHADITQFSSHGEQAFGSAYTQVLGYDKASQDPKLRDHLIKQLLYSDQLRMEYLQAETGIDYDGGTWWGRVNRFTNIGGEGGLSPGPSSSAENIFTQGIEQALQSSYGNRSLESLSNSEVAKLRIEGAKRALSLAAREHANAILAKKSDNTFSQHEIDKAKAKLAELDPNKIESKLDKEYADLGEYVTNLKQKESLVLKKQAEGGRAQAEMTAFITTLPEKLQSWEDRKIDAQAKLSGAKPADRIKLQEEIQRAQTNIQQLHEREDALKIAYQNLYAELDTANADLIHHLRSISDSDIDTVNPPGTNGYDTTELMKFYNKKNSEVESLKKKAEEDKTHQKEHLEHQKHVGEEVLELIMHKKDEVAADFVSGKIRASELSSAEGFLKLLGFEEFHGVMPEDRLAKLMVVFMEMHDISPGEIVSPTKDHHAFEKQWQKISANFFKMNEAKRAEVMLQIYQERLEVIIEKGDATVDPLELDHRTDAKEYVEATSSAYPEELAEKGIHRGVNALYDMVGQNHSLVFKDGKITVYQKEEKQGGAIEWSSLGDMGVSLDSTLHTVTISNPGTPEMTKARNEVLGEMIAHAFDNAPLNTPLSIVGPDSVSRTILRAHTRNGSVVSVLEGSSVIPYADFIAAHKDWIVSGHLLNLAYEPLHKQMERAQGLDHIGSHFKGHVEIPKGETIAKADKIYWKDPADSNKRLVVNIDSHGVGLKEEKKNAQGTWKSTNPNHIDLDAFLAQTDTQDPDGNRRKVLASVFDALIALPPAERKKLSLSPIPLDINAENHVQGRVSLTVNNEGDWVIYTSEGKPYNLEGVLNYALQTNEASRYDHAPHDIAEIMNQPYLKLQSQIGEAFLRARQAQKVSHH